MDSIFIAFGTLTLIFAISAGIIILARYFFPSIDTLIPDDWKSWMTFRSISYFILAAVMLLWLGTL